MNTPKVYNKELLGICCCNIFLEAKYPSHHPTKTVKSTEDDYILSRKCKIFLQRKIIL